MNVFKDFMARIFSSRVRELEQAYDRVAADLTAMTDEEFEKLSITRMTYTPENGLQAAFEGNIAKVFAGWAFNVLSAADAKNYVEFQVMHPESGAILITVQRVRGETPGARVARLERELSELKADA